MLGFIFFKKSEKVEVPIDEKPEVPSTTEAFVEPPPSVLPNSSDQREKPPSDVFLKKLKEIALPTMESLRPLLEQDPHAGPPPQLVKSALQMGELFDLALQNEDRAKVYIDKVKECLSHETPRPESLQVICLSYAGDLEARFPLLKESLSSLREQVSPRLRDLVALKKGERLKK